MTTLLNWQFGVCIVPVFLVLLNLQFSSSVTSNDQYATQWRNLVMAAFDEAVPSGASDTFSFFCQETPVAEKFGQALIKLAKEAKPPIVIREQRLSLWRQFMKMHWANGCVDYEGTKGRLLTAFGSETMKFQMFATGYVVRLCDIHAVVTNCFAPKDKPSAKAFYCASGRNAAATDKALADFHQCVGKLKENHLCGYDKLTQDIARMKSAIATKCNAGDFPPAGHSQTLPLASCNLPLFGVLLGLIPRPSNFAQCEGPTAWKTATKLVAFPPTKYRDQMAEVTEETASDTELFGLAGSGVPVGFNEKDSINLT